MEGTSEGYWGRKVLSQGEQYSNPYSPGRPPSPPRYPFNRIYVVQLHKQKRKAFASSYKHWTIAQWRRVIFSDEKIFRIRILKRVVCWRPKGSNAFEARYRIPSVSRPEGVMVWGAINGRGSLIIRRCPTNMDSTGYQTILGTALNFVRPRYVCTFLSKNCPFLFPGVVHSGFNMTVHLYTDQGPLRLTFKTTVSTCLMAISGLPNPLIWTLWNMCGLWSQIGLMDAFSETRSAFGAPWKGLHNQLPPRLSLNCTLPYQTACKRWFLQKVAPPGTNAVLSGELHRPWSCAHVAFTSFERYWISVDASNKNSIFHFFQKNGCTKT